MTITIEEVLTSTTDTITFSEIAQYDVAFVTQQWVDDGSFLSAVDGEATGWQFLFYGGGNAAWWKQYMTGAESPVETFVTTHIGSMQMIAVRMRSDVYTPGLMAFIDENVEAGTTEVTDFAGDPVLVCEGSDSGTGDFTCSLSLVTLATMANVALHRSDPFQVASGTSISVTATASLPNQQLQAVAFGAWTAPEVIAPVGAGGWTAWIID
jgi:hypothetical protein